MRAPPALFGRSWNWRSGVEIPRHSLIIPPDWIQGTVGLIRRTVSRIDRDPIILSHHPLCGRFDDHVFKVRGRSVCIGCATVYPSALVTALVLLGVGPVPFSIVSAIALSSFAVNLLRFLAKSHRLSVLFNAGLGVSSGAALFSTAYAPEDLRLVVVLVVIAVAAVFSLLKGYRVFTKCKSCEHYPEFPSCCRPGFLQSENGREPGSG